MRSLEVVVVGPRLQAGISLQGSFPVFCVSPFAQGGLDEAFCLAVGLRGIRPGAVMPDGQAVAGVSETVGAITASVVGEQGAHGEAVTGEEFARMVQEADGGLGLLIGEQLSKGQPGVVVDGHMQGQQAGMLALAAQPSIAAQGDFAEAGHALDVQMHQVTRSGVLITHHRRPRMQIAPAAEARAAQDAADRGGGEATATGDLIAGHVLAA